VESDVSVAEAVLPLDAPTASLQRQRSAEREETPIGSVSKKSDGRDDAVVLSDWKFTQFFHRHTDVSSSFDPFLILLLQELAILERELATLETLLLESFSHHHHGHRPPFSPHH
jgi:hypothetical protein